MTLQRTDTAVGDYLPLFGVILGAAISLCSTFFLETWRQKRDARNLAFAFRGELRALLGIIEERRYVESLQEVLREHRRGQLSRLIIPVRREYFAVYTSNVDKIGTLSPPLPERIARFYTLANAILEDLESQRDETFKDATPDAVVSAYEELLRLFQLAIEVARDTCGEIDRRYP